MDSILTAIDINEKIPFNLVFMCIGIWLVAFWLLIAFWVARDAHRRFGKQYLTLIWFVSVLFLSFPALMFYLIIRPDDSETTPSGGLQIPVANFVGKNNEVVMSFQLVVKGRELADQVRDMRIDIDWESADPDKKLTAESAANQAAEIEREANALPLEGLKRVYRSVRSKLKRAKKQEIKAEEVKTEEAKEEAKVEETPAAPKLEDKSEATTEEKPETEKKV